MAAPSNPMGALLGAGGRPSRPCCQTAPSMPRVHVRGSEPLLQAGCREHCRGRLRGSDRHGDRAAEPLCPGPQTGACRNAGLRRRQGGSLACRVPVSSQVRRVVSTSRRSDRFRLVTPGAPEEDRLGIVYSFPLNVFLFHISDWVLVVKLLSVAQHDGHVCKSEVHSL